MMDKGTGRHDGIRNAKEQIWSSGLGRKGVQDLNESPVSILAWCSAGGKKSSVAPDTAAW
jgi:hypothetical protein